MPNNILKPTLPSIMRPGVQGAVTGSLVDECTIRRMTYSVDEYGQNIEVELDIVTVACRVLPDNRRAAGDTTVAGRETGRGYYRIIVPLETDVQDGDTAHVDGVAYEIQRITSGETDALFVSLEVVRIEP